MKAPRRIASLALLIAGTAAAPLFSSVTAHAANAVQTENLSAGTDAWQIPEPTACAGGLTIAACQADPPNTLLAERREIEGYASAVSVAQGGQISFMVSTRTTINYYLQVYRLGWYGGLGGRLLTPPGASSPTVGPLPGVQRTTPTIGPAPDYLIEANWPVSYTLNVGATWTSGYYVVKLIRADGYERYVPFTVRNDSSTAAFLMSAAVTTWQAYNWWGGKNLYGSYNVTVTSPNYGLDVPGPAAGVVSYDRPYGNSDYTGWELEMMRYLEREGRDVTYATDVDLHNNPNLLLAPRHSAFLTVGHDEYWSAEMRANVIHARDEGVHIANFGGNAAYFRIKFDNDAAGSANRRIVCYKNPSVDPLTIRWRDQGLPENAFMGAMSEGAADSNNYIVTDASSWIFNGTGLHNGSVISGLVGYEYDRTWSNGFSPPGLHVVAHSPTLDGSYSESSVYTASSGAIVFAAGTIQWASGLDDFRDPWANAGIGVAVSVPLQRTTANILDRLSVPQAPPPTPTVSAVSPTGGPAAGGTVVTITGTNFSTGAGTTTVTFGPSAGTAVSCASTTRCTATSPPGAGVVDVIVTVGGLSSATSAADRFTYPPPPPPTVSGIGPTSGPAAGGTVVTISGTNFSTTPGATTVNFGSVAGTAVTCASTTSCNARSPAAGSGVVDVTVTVGGLSSATSAADQFTYTQATGLIFSDGFESGSLAAWDGAQGTGTTSVLAAAARTGNFGARLTNTSGQYALLIKRLPSSLTDGYTRFNVRFTATTGSTTVAYGRDDTNNITRWVLYYDSVAHGFTYYLFNSGGTSTAITTGGGVAPLNTWVTVELRYNGTATGGGQIWVNGVSQPSWSTSADLSNTAPYQRLQLWNDAVGSTDLDDVSASSSQTALPVPTVTAISPSSGPANGGTVVQITGTGFSTTAGQTTVNFGARAGTAVSCASTTSCNATSPTGVGVVDVTVTVAGQTSANTAADRFSYPPPPGPTVTGISPTSGAAGGGTIVTVNGTNFSTTIGQTAINFGPNAGTAVSCASTTTCSANSPAGTGLVDVTVTVGGQVSPTGAADQFSYTPGLVFSDGFGSGTLADWDGTQGPGSVSVLAAAARNGSFGVRLADSAASQYAVLTKSLPTSLPDSYTRFSVRFTGTTATTTVAYGRDDASNAIRWILYYNPGTQSFSYYLFNGSGASTGITTGSVAPLGTWTTVELRYTGTAGGGGQIWVNDASQPSWSVSGNYANSAPYQRLQIWNDAVGATDFDDVAVSTSQTAQPPPTVSALSPLSGPAAGGTAVTITGANFSTTAGETSVAFGQAAATSVSCASSTSCTATSPAGAGVVDVRVSVGGLTSATSAADQFSYPPPPGPVVSGITPTSGPAAGGTLVTISGSNFSTAAGTTSVSFGGVAGSAVSCASTTSCRATSPAGGGTVDVTATVSGQTSATGAADQFTFIPGVIFSDGFESGTLAAWDGAQGPGSTTVTAAAARAGNFGARMTDSSASQYALFTKRMPSSLADSYTRFNVRFIGTAAQTTVGYGRDDSNNTTRWILYYDPSSQSFTYFVFNGSGAATGVTTASGVAPLNTWVTVELRYNGTATGGGQIWVNGATQPGWAISGNYSNAAPYQRLQLWNDAVGSTDLDDVSVSTNQTALPVPTVTGISPTSGAAAGGDVVTVSGTNFSTAPGQTTVSFGAAFGTSVNCASTTSCTATTPAGAGVVDVRVTVSGQTSATSAADQFSYPPPPGPTVSAISPTSGSPAGGTQVTISGSNFGTAAGTTTVSFGGTPGTSVACASTTTCVATSPAGTGTVDVTVNVSGQVSPTGAADQFTYTPGAVFSDGFETGTLAAWDGTQGPGSISVVVGAARTGSFGARLTDSSNSQYTVLMKRLPSTLTDSYTSFGVRFSGTAGSTTVAYGRDASNNTVRWILYYDAPSQSFSYYLFNGSGVTTGITTANGVAPLNTWVTVELRYTGTTTGGGQIWVNGVTQPSWSVSGNFSNTAPYQWLQLWNDATGTVDFDDTAVSTSQTAPPPAPVPTVSAISPSSGPAAGGTVVAITGTNFSTTTGATSVSFGPAAGTSVSCASTTSCSATSPAGAGAVDVRVTVGGQTSTTSAADQFNYPPPPGPTVTSISPSSGSPAGGTAVTITGANFSTAAGTTTVSFGGAPGTAVTCASTTSCSATSPAGTGTVDVTATVSAQTSPTSAADRFTYTPGAVFSDGFETGTLSAWEGTQGPGSTTVTAAAARTGGYGVRLTDSSASQYALLSKGLPSALSDSYTRFAIRFSGTAAQTTVAYGRDSSNGTTRWILYYDPSSHAFTYFVFNGSGAATGITTASGVAPLNTWVTVELRYTGTATGGGQIWVNDVTAPSWSVSGNFSNSAPYQRLQLWNDAVGSTDIDDVAVSTSQTGPPPPPAPTITAINPASGPAAGGTAVTITGSNFSTAPGTTTVAFGAAAGSGVSCASTTSCTATSPPGSGTVDVRATVGGQTSATGAADQFTYAPAPAPTVTSINPTGGPAAGGTAVTITGTGFSTTATTVSFGATAGTAVSCASDTSCTATSPAGSGTVDVRATVGGQTSAAGAADHFTYAAPPGPTVSDVSPNSGPAAGGTVVTVNGTNFSTTPGATTVNFGGTAGTAVSCAGSTSCTATSPPGAGTVDVTVTVGGQTSAAIAADQFTYDPGALFSDGFESGTLAGWDGTLGPGSTTVVAAAANTGSFGLRLADNAAEYAVLQKRLASSLADSYTRFSVRFTGTTGVTTVAYGRDDSNSVTRWILYYDPASQSFTYYLFNGSGVSTGITTAAGSAPLGTWLTVELRYTGTPTGGGQIWVNDATQPTWTVSGDFSNAAPYRRLQLWNDVVGTTDVDDVTVSTTRTAP